MPDESNDNFLQSMTFASAAGGRMLRYCDCGDDYCNNLPLSIVSALRERKRIRLSTGQVSIKRTQHRELQVRWESISVYKIIMPLNAQPLVEFGNSHRLIWIQRLPSKNSVFSIGKGIIGSCNEENSRVCLRDWKENSVVFVPSNGGKAVGWLHKPTEKHKMENSTCNQDDGSIDTRLENGEQTKDRSSDGGPAVILVAKIPFDTIDSDAVSSQECNYEDSPSWVKAVITGCHAGLAQVKTDVPNTYGSYCILPENLSRDVQNQFSGISRGELK